eukprot:scaffold2384_cov120-Isochrysis_galbana.AAC.3
MVPLGHVGPLRVCAIVFLVGFQARLLPWRRAPCTDEKAEATVPASDRARRADMLRRGAARQAARLFLETRTRRA